MTIYYFIIVFLTSFGNETIISSPLDCKDFHTGKYETYFESARIEIERTNTLQIEKYNGGYAKHYIRWIDDCRYTLKLFETNIPSNKNLIGVEFIFDILSIDDDTYTFRISSADHNFTLDGKVVKLL